MRHAQPSRPGGGVNDGASRDESPAATETVTVGQALQAVALSPAGARPVDRADASAIQATEKSVTGLGRVVPGGVAAAAHRAAEANEREAAAADARDGGEVGKVVTLRDVLGDAASVMPAGSNRAATWVDAEKVAAATGSSAGRGGGGMGEVADALAAAAHINEGSTL
ncbi:hypothetical protein SETIT_1G212500v2 [Setaria italica]|uniref:SMP domain-containing protein n=2 Tax=Setaria TaxID=4554 RepID=K3Z0W6_SETIT|nr:late embryogenesis abundant protein 3 [Setaria italica]XP_034593769.1 late embryogenesis abundant protein 3-like [Setaria viridis]RCV07045.1 hypothetical protein SETIT_1G212500v2 [Setaria italica]TKW39983.1 hypothetical protein SEVIR_1G216032v2 [Setaria viridis]